MVFLVILLTLIMMMIMVVLWLVLQSIGCCCMMLEWGGVRSWKWCGGSTRLRHWLPMHKVCLCG